MHFRTFLGGRGRGGGIDSKKTVIPTSLTLEAVPETPLFDWTLGPAVVSRLEALGFPFSAEASALPVVEPFPDCPLEAAAAKKEVGDQIKCG